MKAVLLTPEQAEQLKGTEVLKGNLFNPIQDINANWVISTEEQEQCSIQWVKDCRLIEFEPKQETLLNHD